MRNEEKKQRLASRKRRREAGERVDEKEEKLPRIQTGSLNTLDKTGEEKRRRTYIHPYVLASNWPDTVLICLVNMLKRKWELPVDADDVDLYDELREYLFLPQE